MSCHCHHIHQVQETIVPCNSHFTKKCDCCSCCDELSIARLKNTNNELKTLIHKLDDLSVSVESNLLTHDARKNHHHYQNSSSFSHYPRCNICDEYEEVNVTHYEYDQVICKKCENMLRLSKLLDEKPKKKILKR